MLVIAAIALIVLGPKQMILMSRKAGEYMRQFRELWLQLSAAWQKELDTLEDINVTAQVSKEIQGLKQDVQKTLQTLQGEVTTATTIAPPTTAKPVTPAIPANGNTPAAAEAKPELPPDSTPASATASEPAPTDSKPTYSAWIDKSNQG
jgi:sec-independent protein translocase protein TatB